MINENTIALYQKASNIGNYESLRKLLENYALFRLSEEFFAVVLSISFSSALSEFYVGSLQALLPYVEKLSNTNKLEQVIRDEYHTDIPDYVDDENLKISDSARLSAPSSS